MLKASYLVTLEEAEDVFNPSVIRQSLHAHQSTVLRQRRRSKLSCYRAWWSRKVTHCGRGHWRTESETTRECKNL